jgi:hypothetical protein
MDTIFFEQLQPSVHYHCHCHCQCEFQIRSPSTRSPLPESPWKISPPLFPSSPIEFPGMEAGRQHHDHHLRG